MQCIINNYKITIITIRNRINLYLISTIYIYNYSNYIYMIMLTRSSERIFNPRRYNGIYIYINDDAMLIIYAYYGCIINNYKITISTIRSRINLYLILTIYYI